jgi:hypothetical protein
MLSLASLFVMLGFLVLIGFLANAGVVTARKLETQNAADSVAYSASVEMARGMNSITAINHLTGELTALVILIHTLGGDELDQNQQGPSTPFGLDAVLDIAYYAAKGVQDVPPAGIPVVPTILDEAYTDEASKDSDVGGAIYDARMRLKMVLAWAYQAHFIGGIITQGGIIPIVGPALEFYGGTVCASALVFETKVYEESQLLDGLVKMAKGLQKPKEILRGLVPVLNAYQSALVAAAPFKALDAANLTQGPNLVDAVSLYPSMPLITLNLPVEMEDANGSVERSQLMRATTPWVQWWRQPWITFGRDALILSRFATYYETRSTQYTLSIVQKLKQKDSVNLYVMSNRFGQPKTYEPWTSALGTPLADKMFTVVGFAHRPPPNRRPSGNIFREDNPDGMLCWAQAMFYNANAQVPGSGDGDWQPTAGWDTLNWNGPVPEYPGPVPSGDPTPTPTTPQPMIRLNWQCKLVPMTRLTEASQAQGGATGRILSRTFTESPLSRTH